MRWKGIVAYDGTELNGWQSQPGGNTVQDFLEARLTVVFNQPVRVHGSGRTDSGVHARGHAFHFDADWNHSAQSLYQALRVGLPKTILVTSIKKVPDTFHARLSAKGKRYVYYLYEGYALPMETRFVWSLRSWRLNTEAMQLAANSLVGNRNFSAFGARGSNSDSENPIKQLWRLDVIKNGRRIKIVSEASGYLYKMARRITGALVMVGIGKLQPEVLGKMLEQKEPMPCIMTAPAKGLFLEKVFY